MGLYMAPPERAVVLCVDEKSQIQALERSQPMLPLRPGMPARQTHDYKRHGTTSLYSPPSDIATGEVHREMLTRATGPVEFRKFLTVIEKAVPKDLEVHLVLDNYTTHRDRDDPQSGFSGTPASTCTSPRPARHGSTRSNAGLRRSPTSGSGEGATEAPGKLVHAIEDYLSVYNDDPKPFIWTKSAGRPSSNP